MSHATTLDANELAYDPAVHPELYDGVRTRVQKAADGVTLWSRRGHDVTRLYPEIALAARHLPVSEFGIDGEIVALDPEGRPSFERLAGRFTRRSAQEVARGPWDIPVVMYAFDLPSALGRDLRRVPLHERKALLRMLAPPAGLVRYCDHVEREGEALFALAREHGLEGVIGKRADSRYESGKRSGNWLKLKVPEVARLAIAGYQRGRGARAELGALVLAWKRDGVWTYAGKAGSGLDDATIASLLPRLRALEDAAAIPAGMPEPIPRGTTFCRPELVCEVSYGEIMEAGQLRFPVFRGLLDGADPETCTVPAERREEPDEVPTPEPDPPESRLQLSNLDKVF